MQQQSEEVVDTEANMPFPASIYKLAETYQLGTPLDVYTAHFEIDPHAFATVLTLLTVLIFGVLILLLPAQLFTWILLALCCVVIVWGIALASFLYAREHRYARVYVCSSGLLCQKREMTEGVHWHHIETLVYDKNGNFTVHRNDGEQFIFTSPLEKLGELSTAIENAITPHHLPGLLRAYAENLPIVFGPLRINGQGIGLSEQNITLFGWESLTDIERRFDELYLSIDGVRHIRLPLEVWEIPSVCVVQALVRTLLTADEGENTARWARGRAEVRRVETSGVGLVPTLARADTKQTQELADEKISASRRLAGIAGPEQAWTRVLGDPIDAGSCYQLSIVIYERGFIYLDKRMRVLDVIRWDQVEKVTRKAYASESGTDYRVVVHRADGATFLFPQDKPHIAGLGLYIEQRVAQWSLPNVIGQYEQGEFVSFGKLKVSQRGFSYNKNLLPWSEVYGADILSADSSHMSIRQRGQSSEWQYISINNVPNVYLLKLLVEHAVASNRAIAH